MTTPAASPHDGPNSSVAGPPAGDAIAFCSGIGLLASLVAAIFLQTRDFGLAFFEDGRRVLPLLDAGHARDGIAGAFTATSGGTWQPLTTLSLMLDAAVFGDWWGGYHLHNAALHALASAVLFAALTRLTGAMGRSLVGSAVFAVHPLRVESVAWIAGRADVLGGVFLAAALLAYAFFVEKPSSNRRLGAVAACFAAGLLCTGAVAALPLGLLILDWWPLRRLAPFAGGWGFARAVGRRVRTDVGRQPLGILVREKVPLVAVAAAWAVFALIRGGPADPNAAPFFARVAATTVACASHVVQIFWPVGLAPHAVATTAGPGVGPVLVAAGFIVALTAGAWFWRRRWPSFTAGWAWYLVMLPPIAALLPGLMPPTADRGTYIAQIWLIVAVVWGLADRVEKLPVPKSICWAMALTGLLLLTWGCWAQTRAWHDGETLWRHTLATLPAEASGEIDPAFRHKRAAALNPTFAAGWVGLGDALQADGRGSAAEEAWQKAAAVEPGMAAAWIRLAHTALDRSDWRQALPLAEKAAQTGGGGPAAATLARALEQAGRRDDAVAALRRALVAEPGSALVLVNLAVLLERQGARAEAATLYRQAAERFEAAGNADLAGAATAHAVLLERPSLPANDP
jgi:Flp pilus assembly protein TadD